MLLSTGRRLARRRRPLQPAAAARGLAGGPLQPLEGWRALPRPIPWKFPTDHLGAGGPEAGGLRVALWEAADASLVGKAVFGPRQAGAPGHVHGGAMFSLLDELAGLQLWLRQRAVMTGTLSIAYRAPLRTGAEAVFEVSHGDLDGSTIDVQGRISTLEGRTVCEASGVFVRLSEERVAQLRELHQAGVEGAGGPVGPRP